MHLGSASMGKHPSALLMWPRRAEQRLLVDYTRDVVSVRGSLQGCSLPYRAVLVQTVKKIVLNHHGGLRAKGFQWTSGFPSCVPPAELCAAAAVTQHSEAFLQKVGSQAGWVS